MTMSALTRRRGPPGYDLAISFTLRNPRCSFRRVCFTLHSLAPPPSVTICQSSHPGMGIPPNPMKTIIEKFLNRHTSYICALRPLIPPKNRMGQRKFRGARASRYNDRRKKRSESK
jgi:hypothetical protein